MTHFIAIFFGFIIGLIACVSITTCNLKSSPREKFIVVEITSDEKSCIYKLNREHKNKTTIFTDFIRDTCGAYSVGQELKFVKK